MEHLLNILDRNLKSSRPEFYAKLNAPLNETDIKELEDKYDMMLPEDLKMFYRWKNGQNADAHDAFVNNSMFLPLEEALETAAELTSMIGLDFEIEHWWHKDWLPILHNGGGSYICHDAAGLFTGEKGQLIEYWNDDNDRNVIAPDLQGFIAAINKYYDTVPAASFDRYFEIGNIEGFPKKYRVN